MDRGLCRLTACDFMQGSGPTLDCGNTVICSQHNIQHLLVQYFYTIIAQ